MKSEAEAEAIDLAATRRVDEEEKQSWGGWIHTRVSRMLFSNTLEVKLQFLEEIGFVILFQAFR